MRVTLLSSTPEPLRVLYTAAHTCYSAYDPTSIYIHGGKLQAKPGDDPIERELGVVMGCIKRNHNSVMRHCTFTYGIDGISRACANQLTRHSAGTAWDQQSLRYVKLADKPEWVIPDHLSVEQQAFLRQQADQIFQGYTDALAQGLKAEDARSLLPLCTPTNLVATVNLAALIHLHRIRVKHETGKAQAEIAQLVSLMVQRALTAEPWLNAAFD